MTSVGQVEYGMSAPASLGTRPAARAEDDAADPAAGKAAHSDRAAPDRRERGADEKAIDERTLDRMALRLVKRDPGLAIEHDEVVRRYVYRFLDAESGDQIRQFPADKVLETMRALRQVSDHLQRQREGEGVAV